MSPSTRDWLLRSPEQTPTPVPQPGHWGWPPETRWFSRVTNRGMKLLVAADPDSLSGKAKKARSYGIPVVGETYLQKLLG